MLKSVIDETVFFLVGMEQTSSNKSYYAEIDKEKGICSEKMAPIQGE